MIIACPACDTRYAVPDSAIGAEGRTLRCAKCRHSWFQEPPPLDLNDPLSSEVAPKATEKPAEAKARPPSRPPAPPPAPAAAEKEPENESADGPSVNHWKSTDYAAEGISSRALKQGLAEQSDPADTEPSISDTAPPSLADVLEDTPPAIEGANDPLAGEADHDFADAADDFYSDEPAFEEQDYAEGYEDAYDEDDVSQFDYSPPFTARRSPLKMWTAAAAIFAVMATGTVVAVNYYGLPDWLPIQRPTFGIGQADLELDFPKAQQRTETLESGEEIFRVSGAISNTGRETVAVPSLLIVFRDERDKPVGNWIVVPSKSELAPGESLNVTEAIADIPPTADAAEIGWSPN